MGLFGPPNLGLVYKTISSITPCLIFNIFAQHVKRVQVKSDQHILAQCKYKLIQLY